MEARCSQNGYKVAMLSDLPAELDTPNTDALATLHRSTVTRFIHPNEHLVRVCAKYDAWILGISSLKKRYVITNTKQPPENSIFNQNYTKL